MWATVNGIMHAPGEALEQAFTLARETRQLPGQFSQFAHRDDAL